MYNISENNIISFQSWQGTMVVLGKVHCLQQNIMMRKKKNPPKNPKNKKPYDDVEIKMGKTKAMYTIVPCQLQHTHIYIYIFPKIN
jgi:hypothetical protein